MHFKLLIAFVEDSKTQIVMETARKKGATGSTLISNARGEGLSESKTFLGLTLETQRDIVMLLVEEHMSREILESIAEAGKFDEQPGSGIAFIIDVEDVVGVSQQIASLAATVEEEI
jgi:nitrogen regulatory protein PII